MSLAAEVRAAYDAAGTAWAQGPSTLYGELARPLLEVAGEVAGLQALDVGTGSGVVADALRAAGARVLACDGALGMLRQRAAIRPPAAVADVTALPFRDGCFDLVTAGFVFNHLPDPVVALGEAGRVLRPGGRVAATLFAGEAAAEVKRALDEAASRHGYVPPAWYAGVRETALNLKDPGAAAAAAEAAGLVHADAHVVMVRVALTAEQVLEWRWGMAHLACFVAALHPERRLSLDADAKRALEGMGALDFPVLVLSAQTGSPASE